jgi:Na+-transporting NADH:ubiquinone oxidoreductase subunit D
MNPDQPASRSIILNGLWWNNPIFRQVLGICSTLAVTNLVLNTMVMCGALTITLGLTCWTVSVLRQATPRNIRMMVQTLIMAFYVIFFDLVLRAYWPSMSKSLGPYVGLIITNCILMGRCEAFAVSHRPVASTLDGLANGLGYSFILIIIAILREVTGQGSLLGFPLPFFSTIWDKWIIMVMPPGAFFTLAGLVWFFRSRQPDSGGKA